jgi:hypothetical protein
MNYPNKHNDCADCKYWELTERKEDNIALMYGMCRNPKYMPYAPQHLRITTGTNYCQYGEIQRIEGYDPNDERNMLFKTTRNWQTPRGEKHSRRVWVIGE